MINALSVVKQHDCIEEDKQRSEQLAVKKVSMCWLFL